MIFLAKRKDHRRDKRKFKKHNGNINERVLYSKSLNTKGEEEAILNTCCIVQHYTFLITKGRSA